MADSFDDVIAGSGPAGCLLADRLTEDSDATVCVLEVGGTDHHPDIAHPCWRWCKSAPICW